MEKLIFDIEINTKLDKAIEQLEEVANATKDIAEGTEDLKKTGKGTQKAVSGLAKGFKGMGLAMKTAGIGLVIEAFNMLKEILMKNQPIVDAIDKGFTALSIVFNQVADVVIDVYDAVSKSGEGFESIGKVIKSIMTLSLTPLKLAFHGIKLGIQELMLAWEKSPLGDGDPVEIERLTAGINESKEALKGVVDEGVNAVVSIKDNIADAVTEVVEGVKIAVKTGSEGIKKINVESALETADALVEQRKAVELLEAGQQKVMLQYQNQAELQRQIRDDESLTFAQRQEANEKLGQILEEQMKTETNLAQKKLDLAKLELAQDSDNLELQKAVIQAETELVDIEERITGQRSEQLTNTNALIKEQADAINELRTAGLSEREAELEQLNQDYQHKLELARKSGQDTVAITEQYNRLVKEANKKFAKEDLANQKALDQKKLAQRKANVDALGNTIKMAGGLMKEGTIAQKGFAVASAVMDTYKAVNMALSSAPPPFSYIQAGLSLAMGLKNVKEIMSVNPDNPKPDTSGGGGGGGGGTSAGGGGRPSMNMGNVHSNINQGQQGADFNLGQSLDAFGGDSPIQAYVVQQDVEEQQQVSTQIQERATL